MSKETFTEAVHIKAKELKINPKFLLFAIAVLSGKPDATETDIAKPYFQVLVSDRKKAAERQLQSKNKKIREVGEIALKPIDQTLFSFGNIIGLYSLNNLVPDSEQILNLHYTATVEILKDKVRVVRKIKNAKSSSLDSLQIIKGLFPQLVEQFKNFAGNFRENDLSLN